MVFGCRQTKDYLSQFRMGVSQVNLHIRRFSTTTDPTRSPFCANIQETEIHLEFQCPIFDHLRSKYLPDVLSVRKPRKHLTTFSVAKFLVCVFNLKVSQVGCEYLSITLIGCPYSRPANMCAYVDIVKLYYYYYYWQRLH